MIKISDYKICIIGLGNVGLDLALNFSKKFNTIGFDINKKLIEKIKIEKKICKTHENKLEISSNHQLIDSCDVYIITVPTPVNKRKKPNLDCIIKVTKLVSKYLSKNNIVIYESTFYPGLTEEICIPIIEKASKFKLNKGFFVGYSPERINIGDNEKLTSDVIKITSGSNQKAAKIIDSLYRTVIKSGTLSVKSIKIAEAVKMVENCQRDLNIAFMNEISKFFKRINIDTKAVIKAASTKWNFAEYYPGLVGGDCIAVDPYYLLHNAKKNNHELKLIGLSRKINEEMINYIYHEIIKKFSNLKIFKLAFFGISYKENCNQINNSMYLKIAKMLKKSYVVDIYDYQVKKNNNELCLMSSEKYHSTSYDAVIIGTKHKKYEKMRFDKNLNKSSIIIDIHGINAYSKNVIL